MRDGFGRKIDYVRISVTDRCNLRCVYCMPEEGGTWAPQRELLTEGELTEVCSVLAGLGISKIKLTGGEPLARKNLSGLVRALKKIPGISQVTLTTNGTLLKDQLPALAKAGLDGVNISIDTLNPEFYRRLTRVGELGAALEGLEAALRIEGLPVKVNCVPFYGEEKEELLKVARLAENTRACVRFIELMPIGRGKQFPRLGEEALAQAIEETWGELKPCGEVLGNGPCRYYSLEGFQGKIGFISAVSHKFCENCNRARLTSAGFFKTCLQYPFGEDLKPILRGGLPESRRREELQEAVKRALKEKPLGHCFGEDRPGAEGKEMWQIGG